MGAGDRVAQPDEETIVSLQELSWNESGLIPVVVQSAGSGEVLMVACASPQALQRTLETGLAHFFSRSRQRLWCKGETSGHYLHVLEVRADCDGDALLYRVRPEGPACHTGRVSCFFRSVRPAGASEGEGGPPSDGASAPSGKAGHIIDRLEGVIADRQANPKPGSYTCQLLEGGTSLAARKLGEEAVETAVAALAEDDTRLAEEAADVVYHLLVLLASRGLCWSDVARVLEARARDGGGNVVFATASFYSGRPWRRPSTSRPTPRARRRPCTFEPPWSAPGPCYRSKGSASTGARCGGC
ncbi:MAG: bifunctional phosphoribosyl-AMP cyclohydrolase/phosphoribosyl-ATP diphosphatase HisIE [Anaerolineae bacterium]|nr:bifunctional phosphoribosyl-AMP cyclohydrolase/phosphoribosyl-ATP diphosphatase HisIE [Anaerolineae bacterium]